MIDIIFMPKRKKGSKSIKGAGGLSRLQQMANRMKSRVAEEEAAAARAAQETADMAEAQEAARRIIENLPMQDPDRILQTNEGFTSVSAETKKTFVDMKERFANYENLFELASKEDKEHGGSESQHDVISLLYDFGVIDIELCRALERAIIEIDSKYAQFTEMAKLGIDYKDLKERFDKEGPELISAAREDGALSRFFTKELRYINNESYAIRIVDKALYEEPTQTAEKAFLLFAPDVLKAGPTGRSIRDAVVFGYLCKERFAPPSEEATSHGRQMADEQFLRMQDFHFPIGKPFTGTLNLAPQTKWTITLKREKNANPFHLLKVNIKDTSGKSLMQGHLSRVTGELCLGDRSLASLRTTVGEARYELLRDQVMAQAHRFYEEQERAQKIALAQAALSSGETEEDEQKPMVEETAENPSMSDVFVDFQYEYIPYTTPDQSEETVQPVERIPEKIRRLPKMEVQDLRRVLRRCGVRVVKGSKHTKMEGTQETNARHRPVFGTHSREHILKPSQVREILEDLGVSPELFLSKAT